MAIKADRNYIARFELDEHSLAPISEEIDYERKIAIRDLLAENNFQPLDVQSVGPYALFLSVRDNRIIFRIKPDQPKDKATEFERFYLISFAPFKRIVKDYFLVCESYYKALRTTNPAQIEAIDMGRRGLHDEGSDLLKLRLEQKIKMDFPTARKLFTVMCSLKWKGSDISSGG